MLFFVDESWQTIGEQKVGALAGVAIRQAAYNDFCSDVFKAKRQVLGAPELAECELKGTSCFARSAFRAREKRGHSTLLTAAERLFRAMDRCGAKVFIIWTTAPEHVTLRSASTTELSKTSSSCSTICGRTSSHVCRIDARR